MLIKEFRIVLPLSVEEYQVAQPFSLAEVSKSETGGGEGIEVLENKPYEDENGKGQYTHKIYHLQSKVPKWVQKMAPKGSLEFHEKAWNAYPYCKTIITMPNYMKEKFELRLDTWHKPDRGETENVHNLSPEKLHKRKVDFIDIADNDHVESRDYKIEFDPTKFKSEKTGRGPLTVGKWQAEADPVMCCYKLVTCNFQWFGLQTIVEEFIMKTERRLFTTFHRQVFCEIDKYIDLTMDDIRQIEEDTKKALDEQLANGPVRGTIDHSDEKKPKSDDKKPKHEDKKSKSEDKKQKSK